LPSSGRAAGAALQHATTPERGDLLSVWNLEERSTLLTGSGEKVYAGIIIGEHNRLNGLDTDPLKAKQLTSIRAAGKDNHVLLSPPTRLTLEQTLAYIGDDEPVDVTPRRVCLRKRQLNAGERRKGSKRAAVPRSDLALRERLRLREPLAPLPVERRDPRHRQGEAAELSKRTIALPEQADPGARCQLLIQLLRLHPG
jgi:hypothetical protein